MRQFLIMLMICLSCLFFSTANAANSKNWTFLIYLNGNNNLDDFGEANIKDMEKVGSDDQVNIVVQWASLSAGKAVRLLVLKSTDPDKVISPIVQDLGPTDMGDYRTLQDFVLWGIKNYPADHYFVNVWNHGSGWKKAHNLFSKRRCSRSNPLAADISYDDTTGHAISTKQLGQAMTVVSEALGHKVDIYGSDACLMAMAEVADEMADSVSVFTGSQEVEPGSGWPYADLLSQWEATPQSTAHQVATILVNAYVKSYQDGSNGVGEVTFSAFDLNKMSDLNKSLANLGEKFRQMNAEDRAKVFSAAEKAQHFYLEDYRDLIDFTKQLSAAHIDSLNPHDISNVEAAAKQFIIANADTEEFRNATGLSIWLPTKRVGFNRWLQKYKSLKFNTDTQWGETLDALFQDVNESNHSKK